MIPFRRLVFFVLTIFVSLPVFAQNTASVSLEAEIQNIERAANRQGIQAEERHGLLVRLARLRQLSGDIEGAARNWLEAAGAIPGRIDDDALLACAYCLAAIGEWDRSAAAIEPLVARYPRARLLDAGIKAIVSGDVSALITLAANPEYTQFKSEIYFLLWKVSSGADAENWRRRLTSEFPQSLEGRLAAANTSSAISVRPSPFWLLINFESRGFDLLPPANASAEISIPAAAQPASGVRLQTGLFGREANAQAQAAALRQAGYSSSIEQRTVNNNPMWAVTVPAGSDTSQTIRELRDAGFESFPIR